MQHLTIEEQERNVATKKAWEADNSVKVEYQHKGRTHNWHYCHAEPQWTPGIIYRIALDPKLRPYNDEELADLVGEKLVRKESLGDPMLVQYKLADEVRLSGRPSYAAEHLLRYFQHLDGSPCGVVEEEEHHAT